MNFGKRVLVLGAASALGLSGAVASAVPSVAQLVSRPTVRLAREAPPPLPRGAVKLGPLAPVSTLRLEVTLSVRDPAALNAFVAAVTNRNSPLFHQFLRPGQFGPRFGPSPSSVAAVRAALRQACASLARPRRTGCRSRSPRRPRPSSTPLTSRWSSTGCQAAGSRTRTPRHRRSLRRSRRMSPECSGSTTSTRNKRCSPGRRPHPRADLRPGPARSSLSPLRPGRSRARPPRPQPPRSAVTQTTCWPRTT